MKQLLLTITVLFVTLVSLYFIYSFFSTSETVAEPILPAALPDGANGQNTDTDAEFLTLVTQSGSLPVRNFLDDPRTVSSDLNPGIHALGYAIDPADPDPAAVPYVIDYHEETQYFNISLLQEPIAEARQEAEVFLQDFLALTPEQLCDLIASVTTPIRVSTFFAGQELGFSVCPDGVVLE